MTPRAAGQLERHGDGDSDDGKRCSVAFTPRRTKHTTACNVDRLEERRAGAARRNAPKHVLAMPLTTYGDAGTPPARAGGHSLGAFVAYVRRPRRRAQRVYTYSLLSGRSRDSERETRGFKLEASS